MKVLHTLICFFLSLQDSKTRLAGAEVVWTGTEGGAITVTCSFSLSGKKRLFCKEKCGEGDVLIETEDDIKKSGRYIIQYEEGFYPVLSTLVHVTIKQLTMSDSGSYECGLKRSLGKDGYEQIRINVRGGSLVSHPGWTLPLVARLVVMVLLAASIPLLYRWKRRGCADLNGRTSTSGDNYSSGPMTVVPQPPHWETPTTRSWIPRPTRASTTTTEMTTFTAHSDSKCDFESGNKTTFDDILLLKADVYFLMKCYFLTFNPFFPFMYINCVLLLLLTNY
ncbi:uncharacterized protein LOC118316979 isoform X2 [Scophthalmus maximus]|uniref:uncharacterized protein LOC118316979 isoform X2 n=1 Tax=Scophthalmus maximus TaxID=52904 RepID=UPI001FA84B6E|nr:uncharacterized protein LOC118316979 isoform X2 [Scophthalmus maximus]